MRVVSTFVKYMISMLFVLVSSTSIAGQFNPPDQINYSGNAYKLAYQNKFDGQSIYEYTSNEESVDSWTTLITLVYKEGLQTDIANWSKSQKEVFDQATPQPFYNFFSDGVNAIATVIYKPIDNQPSFEAGMIKSFHESKCGGLVLYQFSRRYQKSIMFAVPDYQAVGKDILEIVKETKKVGWTPSCN